MLLLPFACESAQLIALSETTLGTVESVGVRRGTHGTSAPTIEYAYTVEGRLHRSGRFSPGFLSGGTWTGGGRAARDYRVGQTVLVHYNPDRPAHACIAYGWHAWSIGLPLFLIGMGLQGWGSLRRSRRGFVAQVAGWTLAPLGFASLGLIRDVLHPSELPTAAVFAASLLWRVLERRSHS